MGIDGEKRGYDVISSKFYADLRASGFILGAPKPLFPRLELTEAEG